MQGGAPQVLALGSGGRLEWRPVSILGRNPEWVAIKGIDAETRVLREVRDGRPGQRVRPIAGPEPLSPRGS